MSATIEIKYYNSFWLKKMASITAVSSLETTGDEAGVAANTADTVGDMFIGDNTLTFLNADALSIGIGQELSYTIGTLFTYTIIDKVISGANTIVTLSKDIFIEDVPEGTSVTFGKILNSVWLPSVYKSDPDVEWYIEEYDGQEWVAEKHRTWR